MIIFGTSVSNSLRQMDRGGTLNESDGQYELITD